MKCTRKDTERIKRVFKELGKQQFLSKAELKKASGGAYAVTSDDLNIRNRRTGK